MFNFEELIGVGGKGNETTLPVDPSVTTTQNASGGWSFLDQLGGAFVGAIPKVLDNVTQRTADPVAASVVPDQTMVHGDAQLTKENEPNFFEQNWKMIGGGLLAVAGLIFIVKKA